MSTSRVSLYGPENLEQATHSLDTEFSRKAYDYCAPMIRDGVDSFVSNIRTRMYLLRIDGILLPLTLNDEEYDNAYVVSPYTQYVRYAHEELSKIGNRFVEAMLGPVILALGAALRIGSVNRVAIVNNWLFSTCLYPSLSREQIREINAFLRARFPKHAILYRSILPGAKAGQPDLSPALEAEGARLILSRQVYLWEPKLHRDRLPKDLKRDFDLFGKKGCSEQELAVADQPEIDRPAIDRVDELYRQLYIDKYSKNNPVYTTRYWLHALASRTLKIALLRLEKTAQVVGFCSFFEIGPTTVCPAIGHDLSRPQSLGLYRMVEALSFKSSIKKGSPMNLSAGAPAFKRARGGVPEVEYLAVFDRHLSWIRRMPWAMLRAIANGLALPIIRRYEL